MKLKKSWGLALNVENGFEENWIKFFFISESCNFTNAGAQAYSYSGDDYVSVNRLHESFRISSSASVGFYVIFWIC